MPLPNALLRLFAYDISGMQPRIVEWKQPLRIIGLTIDTDLRRIYRDVPSLGKKFNKIKQTHPIPNRKQPWAFAAVSKDFDREKGTFSYFIGDAVIGSASIPTGLIAFEIPACQYAIFSIRQKNRFGWGIAIADGKNYIYNVWLPNSEYQPAGGIDDFEYHDERSIRKNNPEIDLYIAIRGKH